MNVAAAAPSQLEQRLADQRALIQVVTQINRSLDLDDVLTSSREGIQRVIGSDLGCFLLIQPGAPALQVTHVAGLSAPLLEQLQRLTFDVELLARASTPRSQSPVIAVIGQAVREILEAQRVPSFTLLPLTARGRAIGILLVGVGAGRVLAPLSVDLLMSIGEQIGMAIENARLYEQTQQRVQELDGLAQLSAACAAQLDPDALVQLTLSWAKRLMEADTCTVRLIEGDSLRLRGYADYSAVENPTLRMPLEVVARSVIEDRKPYVITNLQTDSAVTPFHREHLAKLGVQALLSVPMPARDRVIGILAVGCHAPHVWEPRKIDLLQTIANQTANAIDNAQLYQNVLNEKRKVQAIFDSGLSGLYATDAAGRITMFNRAAERITGWTFAEVQGKNWADLLSDRSAGNPREPLLDEALIHKKAAYVPEGRQLRTRDGRVIPVAKAAAPLLDEKENVIGAVGAFWDLSKEKRAEIEYENFLAMVTHQLRSPLTSVLSALELFERRNLSDARRAELWTIIKTEGEQLKKLADQFLARQAATQSALPVQFETLSVVALARQLVPRFRTAQSKHHFRVQAAEPEPRAFADANRVEHVLRNLLDNAVSYSPAGSRITVRIKPQDEDWIDVSVQDPGGGIPVAEQDHIFQPFYRVPQTSARRVYGHGLGLALAKEMVTAMGGRIWVESEPDHGATFHFTLRRAR